MLFDVGPKYFPKTGFTSQGNNLLLGYTFGGSKIDFAPPSEKGCSLKQNNLLSKESKFFPFVVDTFFRRALCAEMQRSHKESNYFPFRVNPFQKGPVGQECKQ